MDRKVKHYDKPAHQRWLYRLSDMGIVKAIMVIWAICWILIGLSIILVKVVISYFEKG